MTKIMAVQNQEAQKPTLYEVEEVNGFHLDENLYTHPHGRRRGAGYFGYKSIMGDIVTTDIKSEQQPLDNFNIVPWKATQEIRKAQNAHVMCLDATIVDGEIPPNTLMLAAEYCRDNEIDDICELPPELLHSVDVMHMVLALFDEITEGDMERYNDAGEINPLAWQKTLDAAKQGACI